MSSDLAEDMADDLTDDLSDDLADDMSSDLAADASDDLAEDMADAQGDDQGVDMEEAPSFHVILRTPPDTVSSSWIAPGAATFKLLRRENAAVDGVEDAFAVVVYEGAQRAFSHPTSDLLPSVTGTRRVYHYALFGCDAGGACQQVAQQETLELTLTQALQGGGYTLHWRHASASTCSDQTGLGEAATTTSPGWWRSCEADCAMSTARQLTDPDASTEMSAIRDYMDQRDIPFSRALSSEFCRCVRTAEGLELGPAVEELEALTFYVYDEALRCAQTYDLLNTSPEPRTNVGMVGHAGFTCPTLDALAWGEAAIFKPQPGQQQPLLVTRVLASDWAALP